MLAGVRIEDLLRGQDGVVSRDQALRCGLSRQAIRRRVAGGRWVDVHPGVLRDTGHRPTPAGAVRAAGLWAGRGALVDGPAAAYWLGLLDGPPAVVGVTVPVGARRRVPAGIRLRRRDVPRADHDDRHGLGVTAVALTVLETCRAVPDGAAFLDRALQRRRVLPEQLHRAYCRNAGAHGMAAAHRLLVAALDRADSALERALLRLLREAGLHGAVTGHPFRAGPVDVAYPAERVAIELDGWAWHTDPDRFAADRAKGNALVADGWTLLRFTWRDVTEHPHRTVAAVRRALGR